MKVIYARNHARLRTHILKTQFVLPVLAAVFCLNWIGALGAATKPNIIVILTDDQGFADLGIQNVVEDIRTPNLDRLAREGVRFTDGYITSPQCTPSRAGLISGQYNSKIGVDHNGLGVMQTEVDTVAERLRDVGYATGFVGKWHLDPNWTNREFLENRLGKDALKGPKTKIPYKLIKPYTAIMQGFDDVYDGAMYNVLSNYDFEGKDLPLKRRHYDGYRIHNQTKAGLALVLRHFQWNEINRLLWF